MRDDDHFNELLRRIRALEAGAGGGGLLGVRVEDEGTSIVGLANALNFVGAGVAVTNAGSNEATVTISGAAVTSTAYVHNQGVAAAVWTVTHNLGFFPNVTILDSGGSTVEGEIAHSSVNVLTITFSGAFSGTAFLS